MKAASNDTSTTCLIEYVKYGKSDALLIAQKRTVHKDVYTSESQSEIDPEPVAF